MKTLKIFPKTRTIDITRRQLERLKAHARSMGCDALLIELAPAVGCDESNLWVEINHA